MTHFHGGILVLVCNRRLYVLEIELKLSSCYFKKYEYASIRLAFKYVPRYLGDSTKLSDLHTLNYQFFWPPFWNVFLEMSVYEYNLRTHISPIPDIQENPWKKFENFNVTIPKRNPIVWQALPEKSDPQLLGIRTTRSGFHNMTVPKPFSSLIRGSFSSL